MRARLVLTVEKLSELGPVLHEGKGAMAPTGLGTAHLAADGMTIAKILRE